MTMLKEKQEAARADFIATIPEMEGFERTEGDGYHDGWNPFPHYPYPGDESNPRWVRLSGPEEAFVFNISLSDPKRSFPEGSHLSISGHTLYKATRENGESRWYTRSRRGVDESFYAGEGDDAEEIIVAQLDKIEEARGRIASCRVVPGTNLQCSADRHEQAKKDLAAGHLFRLTPAGFGTGYEFRTRRTSRWSHRATKEQAEFFGVKNLYYDTLDCD